MTILVAVVGTVAVLALFISFVALDECFQVRLALNRHLGKDWDDPFNVTDFGDEDVS